MCWWPWRSRVLGHEETHGHRRPGVAYLSRTINEAIGTWVGQEVSHESNEIEQVAVACGLWPVGALVRSYVCDGGSAWNFQGWNKCVSPTVVSRCALRIYCLKCSSSSYGFETGASSRVHGLGPGQNAQRMPRFAFITESLTFRHVSRHPNKGLVLVVVQ